jgi:hypothetical protein
MARFQILAQMMTVPKPLAIGEADTPAEAVSKARELEQRGRQDLQIGDIQAGQYFSIATFAAKYGVR